MPLPPDGTDLHLLRCDDSLTFEAITDFFRALTGREPTDEDMAESRKVWEEFERLRKGDAAPGKE